MTFEGKEPWLNFPDIWPTEAKYMTYLRGGIRGSLWSKSPIKLEFLKTKKKRIINPNPRGKVSHVFGATCEQCNKDYVMKDINVDHRIGLHSLKTIGDLRTFVQGLTWLTFDDLAILCITCHKAKSLSERRGISIDEAIVEKLIIKLIKDKQDKEWLGSVGVIPASNQKLRRQQITEFLANSVH